ncbi:MAG TPA: sensor histidine kinase [Thermomicrobiales bacterium]|nr:sensor histidine kinase [Thermomicrobiales bacterium]
MGQSADRNNTPANGSGGAPAGDGGASAERAFWERHGSRFTSENLTEDGPDASGPAANRSEPDRGPAQPDFLGRFRAKMNQLADYIDENTTFNDPKRDLKRDARERSSERRGKDIFTNFVNPDMASSRTAITHPDFLWARLREIPGVKSWKILNDSLFLALSFVLGLLWFVVGIVMFSLGVGLLIVWVGIPILAATFALMIWGAQLERSRIKMFMGVEIPTPYAYLPKEGKPWKRAWGFVRNPQLWRDVTYLFLLFPIGIFELAVLSVPLTFLTSPLIFVFGGSHSVYFWSIGSFGESLLAFIFGLVVLVPFSMLINFVALMHVEFGRWLLAPTTEEVLTERVEELTESRSAVMRAMHMERRRIERDLHDGAQQRLVNLAMELGLAREKMGTDLDATRKLLEESHEEAKMVLTELRELVRGIHPAVLTDRGLDAAISAIAGRSPIPVGVDINLKERHPDEVEGTAYFVVVESLTNIAKHSGATEANVSIRKAGSWLRIVVSDNGRGGADPTKGTGLRGLQDRIAALDGRFAIDSPVGVGTSILVEIPCA